VVRLLFAALHPLAHPAMLMGLQKTLQVMSETMTVKKNSASCFAWRKVLMTVKRSSNYITATETELVWKKT
jgi:hypothetical protein